MRLAGQAKARLFSPPAGGSRADLVFPAVSHLGMCRARPCIGDGGALHAIAGDQQATRYGNRSRAPARRPPRLCNFCTPYPVDEMMQNIWLRPKEFLK